MVSLSEKYGRFSAPTASNSGNSPWRPLNSSFSSPSRESQPLPRTNSEATGVTYIDQQVAEWDLEMDSIDKKQEQLLNDQWRLLRTQIGSLMSALSEVKADVADLRANVLPKELESTIEKMIESHDGHDANHSSVVKRLEELETSINGHADAHAAHAAHKATMEERMEYVEKLIGDNADKHAAELANLASTVDGCSKAEHHANIQERVQYLENFLGESADKHEEHKATLETRLEFLEGLMGDSADKHAKEIEAAHSRLADLHEAISSCAKTEHHSSLEERMEYLERMLGESADNHTSHKTTIETRMEYIESLIGDSAEKHADEINSAQAKLHDLHAAVSSCAKTEHHGALESRVDELENLLGLHGSSTDQHKSSVESKFQSIETQIGSAHLKYNNDLAQTKAKLDEVAVTAASCISLEQYNGLLGRFAVVEKGFKSAEGFIQQSWEKNEREWQAAKATSENHKNTVEQRLEYMERMFATSTGPDIQQLANELTAAQVRIREMTAKIDQQRVQYESATSNREQRLAYVEQVVSESAGGNAIKHIDQRFAAFAEDERAAREAIKSSISASVKEQLDLQFAAIHSASGQSKELWDRESSSRQAYMESYKSMLSQERAARGASCHVLEERIMNVERALGKELPKAFAPPPTPAPAPSPSISAVSTIAPVRTLVAQPMVSSVVAPAAMPMSPRMMSPRPPQAMTQAFATGPQRMFSVPTL